MVARIRIRGSLGPKAEYINGEYVLAGPAKNGAPAYQKVDASKLDDLWLVRTVTAAHYAQHLLTQFHHVGEWTVGRHHGRSVPFYVRPWIHVLRNLSVALGRQKMAGVTQLAGTA